MSAAGRRLGLTLPLDSTPLCDHPELLREAERGGYTDAWTGETDRSDAFTPLALAATCTDHMRLGTGIASVFTRGPALLAMTAAALNELAPGRFCLGVGSSSNVIVERWNSLPFERPLTRVREVVGVVRGALAGERVTIAGETLKVQGFRLSRLGSEPIPIFVAALRARMLRLAGEVGDGVLLNWLSAGDIPKAVAEVERGRSEAGREGRIEVACRVFVCPGDPHRAELAARRFIAAYMTVPVYRMFQDWLGRGEVLAPMNEAWAERRRQDATEVIPEDVVRDLVIFGDVEAQRRAVESYFENGVDTVILHILPTVEDADERAQQVRDTLMQHASAHQPG
jgi:probable F420-dependent oxidoreductase